MSVVPFMVEQHAEQIACLWTVRDHAVHSPNFSLEDLAALDDRLEANFEGLQIAGEAGWEACAATLVDGRPGETFAAAVLGFASGREGRVGVVLRKTMACPALARGLNAAMGWLPYEQVETFIQELLAADSPLLRRVGIAASAIHRRTPREALAGALAAADAALRARALRAVGEMGQVDLYPAVREHLTTPDPSCRFWAAWSAALLGADDEAIGVLMSTAQAGSPFAEKAVAVVVRQVDRATALAWQRELAHDRKRSRLAILGAGALGDPALAPWLIEQMHDPSSARVAGEALSWMTGLDLAREHLDGAKPEGFHAGPTDDPEDENVAMDPDERLAWPDAEAICAWWEAHPTRYVVGTRYVLGRAMCQASLAHALRHGNQRQRAAAAMELAIRRPGQPLFEIRAPGRRQQELLGLTGIPGGG